MNGKIDMTSMKLAFPKQPKRKKGQKAKSALQKKKDNPNSSYWKKKADKAWGAYHHHFHRYCIVNNESCAGPINQHHLITRGNVVLRHHIDNGVALCVYHHLYSPTCSAHMGPIGFSAFLQEQYPEKYEWVLKNQHKTGKPNYKESYEILTEHLELDKYE